jgi:peroxiredoxin Q/BCP|tara:strand:- start:222 stop:353 length:132 start_codon:yes stop_codon:yes gene_type:complete
MLEVGSKAPDFTLDDQDGNPVSLSSFKGQKVLLWFYPKASTGG